VFELESLVQAQRIQPMQRVVVEHRITPYHLQSEPAFWQLREMGCELS
jgi:hypothetical protein